LNGSYIGKLLVAVCHDANNNILPIAYAIVDEETNESWGWFMRQLEPIVMRESPLCVISDRHPGLRNAMTQGVWEGVSHRYCLRHIASNYAKYEGTTKAEKDLVWQAGAELQKRVAKAFLDNLKEVNPGGFNYLHDPQGSNPALTRDKWCLSYDGGVRWGTLTTNISESYNNVLKGVRHLPITALIQGTFTKTVALFAARVEQGNRWRYVYFNHPCNYI
jgi:transposase-like protein